MRRSIPICVVHLCVEHLCQDVSVLVCGTFCNDIINSSCPLVTASIVTVSKIMRFKRFSKDHSVVKASERGTKGRPVLSCL